LRVIKKKKVLTADDFFPTESIFSVKTEEVYL